MRNLLSYLLFVVFFLSCSGKEEHKLGSEKKIMDLTFMLEGSSKAISLVFEKGKEQTALRHLLQELSNVKNDLSNKGIDKTKLEDSLNETKAAAILISGMEYPTIEGAFRMNTLKDLENFNIYLYRQCFEFWKKQDPKLSDSRVKEKFDKCIYDIISENERNVIVDLKFIRKDTSQNTSFVFRKNEEREACKLLNKEFKKIKYNLIQDKNKDRDRIVSTYYDILFELKFILLENKIGFVKLEGEFDMDDIRDLCRMSEYLKKKCKGILKKNNPRGTLREVKEKIDELLKTDYSCRRKKSFCKNFELPNWLFD